MPKSRDVLCLVALLLASFRIDGLVVEWVRKGGLTFFRRRTLRDRGV